MVIFDAMYRGGDELAHSVGAAGGVLAAARHVLERGGEIMNGGGAVMRFDAATRALAASPACCGAWPRVTIDQFRHLALQTIGT